MSKNGNPIQIRLPLELEKTLRDLAYSKNKTINSIVIECLNKVLMSKEPDTTDIEKMLKIQSLVKELIENKG